MVQRQVEDYSEFDSYKRYVTMTGTTASQRLARMYKRMEMIENCPHYEAQRAK